MDAYVKGTALKDLTTSREMYPPQPEHTQKCYMSAHQCQTVPTDPSQCSYGCKDMCHLNEEIVEEYKIPTVTTCPPVPKGVYGPNRGGDGFKTNEETGNSAWTAFNPESMTSFHSAADNLTPPPQNPEKYQIVWPASRTVSKSTVLTEYTKVIAKAEHDLKQCDLEIDKLHKYRKSIIKALRDLQRVQKDNNRSGR